MFGIIEIRINWIMTSIIRSHGIIIVGQILDSSKRKKNKRFEEQLIPFFAQVLIVVAYAKTHGNATMNSGSDLCRLHQLISLPMNKTIFLFVLVVVNSTCRGIPLSRTAVGGDNMR